MRVPTGVTLAPKDFDEVTIDYPALPYRAWAERHAALVAYWRLDEAAVALAVDSKGATPLTYGGGNDLQYRAFRQETSAVPYGGAPEWTHTSREGFFKATCQHSGRYSRSRVFSGSRLARRETVTCGVPIPSGGHFVWGRGDR